MLSIFIVEWPLVWKITQFDFRSSDEMVSSNLPEIPVMMAEIEASGLRIEKTKCKLF